VQLEVLCAEPLYALEVRLIAPTDHPLARRRRAIRPQDLRPYPIINRLPGGGPTPIARVILGLDGARRGTGGLVHTGFANSVRRFVKLGYGIGLIPVAPSVPPDPDLHELPLRHPFGDVTVGVVRRWGGSIPAAGEGFIRLVREELGSGLSRSEPNL
jgi:DNA-binding transcriptional LysR family regulator